MHMYYHYSPIFIYIHVWLCLCIIYKVRSKILQVCYKDLMPYPVILMICNKILPHVTAPKGIWNTRNKCMPTIQQMNHKNIQIVPTVINIPQENGTSWLSSKKNHRVCVPRLHLYQILAINVQDAHQTLLETTTNVLPQTPLTVKFTTPMLLHWLNITKCYTTKYQQQSISPNVVSLTDTNKCSSTD